MALIVATDASAGAAALALRLETQKERCSASAVLLHGAQGGGALERALRPLLPELALVEAGSARAGRLNYGALSILAVDLPAAQLGTSQARRLFDALQGLMAEGLLLLLVGEAAALAGSLALSLHSGLDEAQNGAALEVGLGLIPGALVLPALQAGMGLREPLLLLSEVRGRLIALEPPAALLCEEGVEGMTFTLSGGGHALLATFVEGREGEGMAARLLPLQPGRRAHWPTSAAGV